VFSETKLPKFRYGPVLVQIHPAVTGFECAPVGWRPDVIWRGVSKGLGVQIQRLLVPFGKLPLFGRTAFGGAVVDFATEGVFAQIVPVGAGVQQVQVPNLIHRMGGYTNRLYSSIARNANSSDQPFSCANRSLNRYPASGSSKVNRLIFSQSMKLVMGGGFLEIFYKKLIFNFL
jgi:hypothetical protein